MLGREKLEEAAKRAAQPSKLVKQESYHDRHKEAKGPKTQSASTEPWHRARLSGVDFAVSCPVTNINARIVYKTATSDKFIYHEIGKTAALPSSMVAASARSLGWGDRQPQEIACDKCATLLALAQCLSNR